MLRRKRKRKNQSTSLINALIFATINNFKRSVIYLGETIAISDRKIYNINQEIYRRRIVHNRFGKEKKRHSIRPANRPITLVIIEKFQTEKRKESWERRRTRSFSTLASWSIPVMIKGNEVSDTTQGREKKGEKETFRRISLPPRMVNSISLPFSRGNVLDPMGTGRKFAVSFQRSVISYSVYICDPPPPRVREGVAPIRRIGGRFYAPGIDSEKRNETKRSGLDDRLKEMIEKRLPSCRLIPIFKRNTVSHRDIFDEIPAVVKKYPSNPWLQKLQLDWNGPGGSCPPIPADFQSSKYTLVPFPTFCLYSLPHFSLLLIPVAHRFLHLAVDPAIVIAAAAFAWPLGPISHQRKD